MYKTDRVSSIEEMKEYDRGFWANESESLINIKFRPLHHSVTNEDLDNIVKQIYNSKGNILLIGASNAELIRDIIIPVSKLLKIDLPIIKHDEVEILGKRVILLPTNHKDEFAIKGTNFSLVISFNIDSLNEAILYEALTRMRSSESKLFILSTTSNRNLIQYIEDKLNVDEVNYSHVALRDYNFSDTIRRYIDGCWAPVKSEFNIANLVVKDEADIRRIAEELQQIRITEELQPTIEILENYWKFEKEFHEFLSAISGRPIKEIKNLKIDELFDIIKELKKHKVAELINIIKEATKDDL